MHVPSQEVQLLRTGLIYLFTPKIYGTLFWRQQWEKKKKDEEEEEEEWKKPIPTPHNDVDDPPL